MASSVVRRPTITALHAGAPVKSPLESLGYGLANTPQDASFQVSTCTPVTATNEKPVPSLAFNLFRSPSIYSVDSSSDSISLTSEEAALEHDRLYGARDYITPQHYFEPAASGDDDTDTSGDNGYRTADDETELDSPVVPDYDGRDAPSPSTPRPERLRFPQPGTSPGQSGATTPTGFRVLTRPGAWQPARPQASIAHDNDGTPPSHPYGFMTKQSNDTLRSNISEGTFTLRPVPDKAFRGGNAFAHPGLHDPASPIWSQSGPISRDVPQPHHVQHNTAPLPDTASVHGEQGSEWGDDEAGFEWLDSDEPEAVNGNGRSMRRKDSVIQRKLSQLTAAVSPVLGSSPTGNSTGFALASSQSSAMVNLEASPNATPSTSPTTESPTQPGQGSSDGQYGLSSTSLAKKSSSNSVRRKKKNRPIVVPRRAAPPPPADAPELHPGVMVARDRSPTSASDFDKGTPTAVGDSSRPRTHPRPWDKPTRPVELGAQQRNDSGEPTPSVVVINATPDKNRKALRPVPPHMNDESRLVRRSASGDELRHASSMYYSYYDLDDSGSRTSSRTASPMSLRANGYSHTSLPQTGDSDGEMLPRGRYAKIPLSAIDSLAPNVNGRDRSPLQNQNQAEGRSRNGTPESVAKKNGDVSQLSKGDATGGGHPYTQMPRHPSNSQMSVRQDGYSARQNPTKSASQSSLHVGGKSPRDLVALGIERQESGDYPRAAWMFMRAAEAGSSVGQIYWGLALKRGMGVARDERRAFGQLTQACDRCLAAHDLNIKSHAGYIFAPQQTRSISPELSLGLYELADCYLEGSGTRRSPETALEYFRMAGSLGDISAQETLGMLLSKGGHGVKKDMKEAAKWYRAAIKQGSCVLGVSWVWKDKYNP